MEILLHALSFVGTVLLLGGAVFIFLRARRNGTDARALYALAFILTAWGAVYLATCLCPQHIPLMDFRPMSIVSLIVGNLFVIFCLPYPLELARPGWITVRRVTLLAAPYLSVTLLYFIVLALLEQPVRELRSIPDMLTNFGEFNVWFRFVLYLMICLYIVYLLMNTGVRAIEIGHGNNIRPADRRLARRLALYGIGMVFIAAAYLGVLLYGSAGMLFAHRAIAICFFGVIIFTVLRSGAAEAEISPEA